MLNEIPARREQEKMIEDGILSAGSPPLRERVSVRVRKGEKGLTKVYIRTIMSARSTEEAPAPAG